ncbi:MAG TPA: Xaa-Pro peptidase family protein [Anaerolineales bacterium]|nr:Xaa-Pro peptidase family protein [Anaerolineales bacterium]
MDHQKRIERLSKLLRAEGLEALAVLPGPNLVYLTGLSFHLMERPVVGLFSASAPPRLIVPEFEKPKAEAADVRMELFPYGEQEGASLSAFQAGLSGMPTDGRAVGVEPLRARFHELGLLKSASPQTRFVSAASLLASLRMTKDSAELAAIRRAIEIAQQALDQTLPLIRLGMTEQELASELTVQLLRAGSEPEIPFSPIIATGPNSAHPHAIPGDRRLAAGELLIIDWGATASGYISDLTRTFAVGEIDPKLAEVHRVVEQANAAGRQAVGAGVPCGEVDRAARTVISSAGYGEFFLHRTGHGIGLEAHEPPYIRDGETTLLEPGMTFTVEPGIYLAGRGGVRVEDNLVVTEQGGESLTSTPRELRVVG